ncbi:MAG: nitrogenase stabilizing/protective protein NifW [Methylovirgula sp.]
MSEILKKLNTLGSAEEFFDLLGVPYEQTKVNVVRMHIMKRMGQYLASEDFEGASEEEVKERCQATLAKAYEDFQKSDPLQERVFKVLKEAAQPKAASTPKMVPFNDLLK